MNANHLSESASVIRRERLLHPLNRSDSLRNCLANRSAELPTALRSAPSCVIEALFMEAKDTRRTRKLKQLCEENGGVRAVAERAGLGWEGLDQILKGTLLPKKADGTRSARALGDPAAEAIEDAFDLGRGWFDWPFDLIDHRRYWRLTEAQRVIAQDRMLEQIVRFEAEKPPRLPHGTVSFTNKQLSSQRKKRG